MKQFTQRVYGLPASEFFERHEPLLATLRQLLVPAKLEGLGQQLLQYAQPQLQDWKRQGKVGAGSARGSGAAVWAQRLQSTALVCLLIGCCTTVTAHSHTGQVQHGIRSWSLMQACTAVFCIGRAAACVLSWACATDCCRVHLGFGCWTVLHALKRHPHNNAHIHWHLGDLFLT